MEPSPRDITLRDFLIEAMAAAVDRPGFTATRNANGYPRSADAIIAALKTEDSEWQVVRRVSDDVLRMNIELTIHSMLGVPIGPDAQRVTAEILKLLPSREVRRVSTTTIATAINDVVYSGTLNYDNEVNAGAVNAARAVQNLLTKETP